jgi:hypothetical protein
MIASNAVEEKPVSTGFMSTLFVMPDQGRTPSPTVSGEPGTHTFASGLVLDFSADEFQLEGGCPVIRDYDALAASGAGAVTHRYRNGTTVGDGAIVMASDPLLATNTVMMSFPWADMRDASGGPTSPPAEEQLAEKILVGVLPLGCLGGGTLPTDVGDEDVVDAVPPVSVLHQNRPNPFNPTTTIRFDLAREGRVTLWIYDVAGRQVRELLDEVRAPGYGQSVTWNGRDANGCRVASGVYFYRLEAPDRSATRKFIVLK